MLHHVISAGHTPAEPLDLPGLTLFLMTESVSITFGTVEASFRASRLVHWFFNQVEGKIDAKMYHMHLYKEPLAAIRAEAQTRRTAIVRSRGVLYSGFRSVDMTTVLQHLSVLTGKGYYVDSDAVDMGLPSLLEVEGYHEKIRRELHGGPKVSAGLSMKRNIKI